jgi:RNA polymerase sigma-70 factor (ECF subfamily)
MLTDSRRGAPPHQAVPLPDGDVLEHADDTLRSLYAQHERALLAYAQRFTNDRGQAEDVVQETFVRAWRHLPALLEDGRPLRPWLLRVARRLLIDAARAARTRPLLSQDEHPVDPAVDGGLDQFLDQALLADAIRQLSPQHQHIVIETFFRGTPTHLTAARLGVPAGTARSRLHYALSQLRRHLDTVDCCAA